MAGHLEVLAGWILTILGCWNAYSIRLYAVRDFGKVIHEFDPWFNFRATQYLADNGWTAFFSWFDHMSWYPLGRPVGTTIYPGMQIVAVFLWRVLNEIFGIEISLNDTCVFIPAWFSIISTLLAARIAYQCTRSYTAMGISSLIMGIVPAHIMRSVAGGFDNESVAVAFMLLTFSCWIEAITNSERHNYNKAALWGVLTGLSYIGMVAAWGGFIFVLNLIASHCMFLTLPPFSRFNSSLHIAYTCFYVIGTLGAIRVPVVGLQPLKSLEQLSGLAVLIGMQVLQIVENKRLNENLSLTKVWQYRFQYFAILGAVTAVGSKYLFDIGYFSPLSSRVRALFVQHTRTGNPLVDSVAEHQPAKPESYNLYLPLIYFYAQVGFAISAVNCFYYFNGYWKVIIPKDIFNKLEKTKPISSASTFVCYYAVVGFMFCNKMSRLILLLGPVASILSAICFAKVIDFTIFESIDQLFSSVISNETKETKPKTNTKPKLNTKKKKGEKKDNATKESYYEVGKRYKNALLNNKVMLLLRFIAGVAVVWVHFYPLYVDFEAKCQSLAERMSHPSIMIKANLKTGEEVIIDDYRDAYFWLRDNTPEDSRILSWWDYGYQITGIGNRTTLADGNTWNHEHIATIGRILTAPPDEAHKIARHLADYVLVWAGGQGDDLAKSPHMARIGNSVYPGLCPNDPTCKHFGFYSINPLRPTKSMEASLLYKLCTLGFTKGVDLDLKLFQPVFQSKYGKVRIYKIMNVSEKSKKWIAKSKESNCQTPGNWYCPGQYPPAIKSFIDSRVDFKQLEDFNKEKDEKSKAYTKEYLDNMEGKISKPKEKEEKQGTLQLVGCFKSEDDLPKEKEHLNGYIASVLGPAVMYGQERGYKYLAIATGATEKSSHVHFFSETPHSQPIQMDAGCMKPCNDYEHIYCGCAGSRCKKSPKKSKKIAGLRRWMVYEIPE